MINKIYSMTISYYGVNATVEDLWIFDASDSV